MRHSEHHTMSISTPLVNNYLMHDATVKSSDQLVVGDRLMGTDSLPKEIVKIDKVNAQVFQIKPLNSESFYVLADDELALMATNMDGVSWTQKGKKVCVKYLTSEGLRCKSVRIPSHDKEETLKEGRRILEEFKKLPTYLKYKDTCEIKAGTFINWVVCWKNSYKIFVQGLEFPPRKVDLKPYAIGYWLGDGTSAAAAITTADKEVIQYYRDYANTLGLMLNERPEIYRYSLSTGTAFGGAGRNPFMNGLKDYDLLNNKHIPPDYMYNSRQARLELLAGIIDSDGSMHCSGYDICLKSKKLSEDIVFLARSLGFAVHGGAGLTKRTCTNAPDGPKIGDYYRFYICGSGVDEIPCLVPRKKVQKGARVTKKSATVSGFKIIDMGNQDYYKITLASPSRVLLQDMTVIKN